MKNTISTMVFGLFLLFLTMEVNAQHNFIVIFKMPPPGTLNLNDLYNITVTNNSGSDLSGYLIGTAKEDKDGMIAKGTTVPIVFKKGVNNIKIKDLPKTPDVEYLASDPKYKESLIRQGKFPSGKYEICVKVISAANNEELGSDCINQEVLETGLLTLISPANGEEIDVKTPLTFTWSSGGKVPEGGYSIKIVEIKGDQSPESAMKSNIALFEQAGIKTTTFQYPNSAVKFEAGKKYAWMVSSGGIGSEVWKFSMMGTCTSLKVDSIKIKCTENPKVLNYSFYVRNVCPDPVKWTGLSCSSSGATISTTPVPTVSVNALSQLLITGSITYTSSAISPVCFRLESESTSGAGYSRIDTCVNFNCNKNCCEGFIHKVTQTLSSAGPLNVTIKAGPKPITKVTLNLVYLKSVTDPNCPICKKPNFGVFLCAGCPLGGFAGATDVHWKEVTWSNTSGVDMFNTPKSGSTFLILDPVYNGAVSNALMQCCKTDIEYCIRYTFTDVDCVTCDTLICSKVSIGGSGPRIQDDSLFQNYKVIEEQLKRKEQGNRGEGQGKPERDNVLNNILTDSTENLDFENWPFFDIEKAKSIIENKEFDSDDTKESFLKLMEADFKRIKSEPVHTISKIYVPDGCQNGNFEQQYSGWEGAYTHNSGGLSFTDTSCITCDTLICRKIVRTNSNITNTAGGNKMQDGDEVTIVYENLPSDDEFVHPLTKVNSESKNDRKNNNKVRKKKETKLFNVKKDVQIDPICIDFSDGSPHGWTSNIGHAYPQPHPGVITSIPSTGGPDGTSYLHGEDKSGQSFMYNMTDYSGDWTQFFNTTCPNFCWDFKIFDYWTSPPVHPKIVISTTFDPAYDIGWDHHPAFWATFEAYSTVTDDNGVNPGWHHYCAPIAPCDNNGNMPNNSYGVWTIWDGSTWTSSTTAPTPGTCADWLNLLQNVECVRISFDYTDNPIEKIGYDQLCLGDCGGNTIPPINCCTDFKKKVTSTISTSNAFNLNVSFSAGPNNIKRITAEIIDFSITYNDDNCATCSNNSDNWGNFNIPGPSSPTVFGIQGKLTVPNGSNSKFGKEIIWESTNTLGENMNSPSSPPAVIKLGLPLKSTSSCCVDTIRMCVRYKFTDVKCITCDTVVCYKIVNTGKKIGMNNKSDERNLSETKFITKSNDGQSAGTINLDIPKTNMFKVTIYDIDGKELMKVYDDNITPGQYSFDLNSYSFPDGLYYCKSEYNGEAEYNKILLTKTVRQF